MKALLFSLLFGVSAVAALPDERPLAELPAGTTFRIAKEIPRYAGSRWIEFVSGQTSAEIPLMQATHQWCEIDLGAASPDDRPIAPEARAYRITRVVPDEVARVTLFTDSPAVPRLICITVVGMPTVGLFRKAFGDAIELAAE